MRKTERGREGERERVRGCDRWNNTCYTIRRNGNMIECVETRHNISRNGLSARWGVAVECGKRGRGEVRQHKMDESWRCQMT